MLHLNCINGHLLIELIECYLVTAIECGSTGPCFIHTYVLVFFSVCFSVVVVFLFPLLQYVLVYLFMYFLNCLIMRLS